MKALGNRLAEFDREIEKFLPPNPPPFPHQIPALISTIMEGRDTIKALNAQLPEFVMLLAAYKRIGFVGETVPPEIVADLNEAAKCFGTEARAYRSSVVMARRALQSVCQHKKVRGNNLKEQIDALPASDAIKSICHGVRLFGNYGAHPTDDSLASVDRAEADTVLTLATHILNEVYG